jgi:phosphatidylglycerol:prolipoprotein diacylglycerol transferase
MYPRLSDLFEALLGVELPIPGYSYGTMVAIAILLGTWLAGREMDRKHEAGLMSGVQVDRGDGSGPTEVPPSSLAGSLAIIAVVAGVLGSKLFTALGDPTPFLRDPGGFLFSMGGLTFYGGLIVAAGAIVWYVRRQGLSVPPVLDAAAPSLFLGYGLGRIGCHLAGDGDWGIAANLAAKPDWLPMWLWAETYPNAVVEPPPEPVYPTSLYEAIAAILLFGMLWAVRKHPYQAGWLFSLYLVFNGVERFLIEKIRVTAEYHVLGLTPTQAEIISVLLFLTGVAGLMRTWERRE